jgi:hypothetical protein
MAVTSKPIVPAPPQPGAPGVIEPKRVQPVKLWAALGALTLAFMAYVLINWVTGPDFKKVPTGPTPLPSWMKAELNVLQVILIPIALGVIYWFLVRPWRRERRIPVDGIFAIAFLTMSFQDPLSAYAQPWFTYNSYLLQYGSWVAGVPGMSAFHQSGAMVNEPLLIIPAVYVIALPIATSYGCFVMRRIRAWRPQTSAPALCAGLLLGMLIFDFIFEGLIMLPLGIWEYPGGHWAILFEHAYNKYPFEETLTFGASLSVMSAVRFFRDDNGHTIVERGINELNITEPRKVSLRILAMIACVNLAFLCCYTLPNTLMSLSQPSWPTGLQQRSYLTDYVCGAETNRLCPGPTTPTVRNGGAYLGAGGKLVVPAGTKFPGIVPFLRH